ncbi:hypothetical protein ACOME3_009653 [Neoechinorhynchus agilis]
MWLDTQCNVCNQEISKGDQQYVILYPIRTIYHIKCIKCNICFKDISKQRTCVLIQNILVCMQDYATFLRPSSMKSKKRCFVCSGNIYFGELVTRIGRIYDQRLVHVRCFNCKVCGNYINANDCYYTVYCGIICSQCILEFGKSDWDNDSNRSEVQLDAEVRNVHKKMMVENRFNITQSSQRCCDCILLSHAESSCAWTTYLAHYERRKRPRTTFKYQQLKLLQEHFDRNHNPDANSLKQLSIDTGLDKRVLQVWFQNNRAKYRKQRTGSRVGASSLVFQRQLTHDHRRESAAASNLSAFSLSKATEEGAKVPENAEDVVHESSTNVAEYPNVVESKLRFNIIRKIGDGMLGQVFLLRQFEQKTPLMALKVMNKQTILTQQQFEHVLNEKKILSEVKNPFIVNFYQTRKDALHLYIFLEYVEGGELYRYIKAFKKFSADVTRFYVVEVICAIVYLHSKHIIYRDLKPENVILDLEGHLKLIDFGFAKYVTHSTWTLCGTLKYLAPEIICKRAYTKAVDWWTLGIMTFEMMTGNPPFNDQSVEDVSNQILHGTVQYPVDIDGDAKEFVRRLLVREPHRRMGSSRNGSAEVKRHQWFRSLSWSNIEAKKVDPPIVPAVLLGDHRHCHTDSDDAVPVNDEWIPGFQWDGTNFVPIEKAGNKSNDGSADLLVMSPESSITQNVGKDPFEDF